MDLEHDQLDLEGDQPAETSPLDLKCRYCGITAREAFENPTKEADNAVAFVAARDPEGREIFACGTCARKNGVTIRHGTMAQYREHMDEYRERNPDGTFRGAKGLE